MPITSRTSALNGSRVVGCGLVNGANPPPISADCSILGDGAEKPEPRSGVPLPQVIGSSGHNDGPSAGGLSGDTTEASWIVGAGLTVGAPWLVASQKPA